MESDPTTRCPARVSNPELLLPESKALPTELPGAPWLENNAVVDINFKMGLTALMIASEGGHVDVLNMLLKHGANVNESDENGVTALFYASCKGHTAAVGALLEIRVW